MSTESTSGDAVACTFEHPHRGQPCGRQIIAGVTRCPCCGNFDESPECGAAGCWQPMTVADLLLDNLATADHPQWSLDV